MSRPSAPSRTSTLGLPPPALDPSRRRDCRRVSLLLTALLLLLPICRTHAIVLWSDLDAILVNENGGGQDILGGAVKRDDSATDTLYFKFHVNPLSDATTEEYLAAFELFEGDVERLGIGNALKAFAYSAFLNTDESSESNKVVGYIDLRSARPDSLNQEPLVTYQVPRRSTEVTFIFKVQFVADGDDLVTVWLNPDLGPGATEVFQPENLTTRFNAQVSFDEIRLRHTGNGGGWTFSEMAIATSFNDFVDVSSAKPGSGGPNAARDTLSLNFHSWQREQGLPHNSIRALTQTRDGYLWVGTDAGLARFDGVRFVPFGVREGIPPVQIRALFGDSHGALWIGTAETGLLRWHNGQTQTITMRNRLPSDTITTLAEDNQGQLWIGTSAGLAVWQNGQPAPLPAAASFQGHPITALFKNRLGILWMGVKDRGVFQFTDGKFIPLTEPSLDALLQDSHCLWEDQAGRIWIGAGDDFVLCREGTVWHRYRIPRHLAKPFVNTFTEEPDGNLWAGSASGGLLQIKDGKLTAATAASGLAGTLVGALLTDRDGKVWVGTDGGLNQLRRKNLFALGQGEGLGHGAVQGLAEVSPGIVWAGKPNDGLYRWDGKIFNRLSVAGLSPRDAQVSTLLLTRDGSCWVTGTNGLLRYKDPRAAADEVSFFELPQLTTTALAEDGDGALWVGTREGKILRLHEGSWTTPTNFLQTNAITALTPGADGTLWAGTEDGSLHRLKKSGLDYFNEHSSLLGHPIRTLRLDGQGALWIGTAGGGLSVWRDDHLASFTTHEGLPDNNITQILEDDAGRLWLGSSRGIICVTKRELDELKAGKLATIHPQVYGRAEGMLSEECTGGFSPAGLKTKSGLLWFSTLKGIAVINPRHQSLSPPVPTVLLEEVLIDGVLHLDFRDGKAESKLLRIPPGKHQLELRYTGLNADAPEDIRFRYKLEGLDPDWVEAGTRRSAFYNYVPPGHYQFRVLASNRDGVWPTGGAGLALVAQRYFWQTWWFIGLTSVGILVLVGGTARLVEKRKLQRRLKRLEEERALERERSRIAQDLHDEMGAKLCRISFLSEHARSGDLAPAELQDQISSISHASREVLHSLDEIVWAVNPRNDTLEHVASYIGQYALEYFQMTGIACELDIPAQLPAHSLSSQIRHHLFLAVHEALTNILKHSSATQARLAMACTTTAFEITVTDNGRGFDSAVIESKLDDPASANDGWNNMHRRLADIGGQCRVEANPGRGTTIWFTLPLNKLEKIK